MKEEKNDLGKLNLNSTVYTTRLSNKFSKHKLYEPADKDLICSFIPGIVLEILVEEGQEVKKGDELLILDSMKMKNRIKSSSEGIIGAIEVKAGDKVVKGQLLIRLKRKN